MGFIAGAAEYTNAQAVITTLLEKPLRLIDSRQLCPRTLIDSKQLCPRTLIH